MSNLKGEAVLEAEFAKQKEKLLAFEEQVKELCKNVDKWLDALKTVTEIEAVVYSDLQKFYFAEESEKILGSLPECAHQLFKSAEGEVKAITPLVNSMKTNSKSVKNQYELTFHNFKKRFHESESKAEINDDLAIFMEQRHCPFDPLLLLILKLKEARRSVNTSLLERTWTVAGAPQEDPLKVLTSCSTVLNNLHGIHYFHTFLAKEFSAENLEFWMQVNNYKQMDQNNPKLAERAQEIHKTFLSDEATKEINISSEFKKKTTELVSNPDLNTFDIAQKAIFHLMESDSFRRFQSDQLFVRLEHRLTKRDFANSKRKTLKTTVDGEDNNNNGSPKENSPPQPEHILTVQKKTITVSGRGLKTLKKKQHTFTPESLPLKDGYLVKQGGNVKSWKKRFFVLTKDEFLYYEKQGMENPLGVIALNEVKVLLPNTDGEVNKSWSFGIQLQDRTYYVCSETKQEREEWLDWIKPIVELYQLHEPLNGAYPGISQRINFSRGLILATFHMKDFVANITMILKQAVDISSFLSLDAISKVINLLPKAPQLIKSLIRCGVNVYKNPSDSSLVFNFLDTLLDIQEYVVSISHIALQKGAEPVLQNPKYIENLKEISNELEKFKSRLPKHDLEDVTDCVAKITEVISHLLLSIKNQSDTTHYCEVLLLQKEKILKIMEANEGATCGGTESFEKYKELGGSVSECIDTIVSSGNLLKLKPNTLRYNEQLDTATDELHTLLHQLISLSREVNQHKRNTTS